MTTLATLILAIALTTRTTTAPATAPTSAPDPIPVQGTHLTFDPRTCPDGATAGFAWALGSVRVTLRAAHDDLRDFEYQTEVEGAGNDLVYRVSVPLTSGPVTIDAPHPDAATDPAHHWSTTYTSFTAAQSTLIRRHQFGRTVDVTAEPHP